MEFQIEIKEILSRTENVVANSEKEAISKTLQNYRNQQIVLDSSDFKAYEIKEIRRWIFPHYTNGKDFTLLHGDCVEIMSKFDFDFDMVFADPPYFLSNGGISVQSGKIVSVNKGEWDKPTTPEAMDAFNLKWISACREHMKDNATIWISGTYHNIFSVQQQLLKLGFKILNVITWAKTNPPPNISCRYFTYSTEFIIWARKLPKVPHYYNYDLMKALNGSKQMTDVWRLPAIAPWEKSCGKHPTQKPLGLLARIIQASTQPGAWVLDPFNGSGTTGIAANLLGRRYLGLEIEEDFLNMSKQRRLELDNDSLRQSYVDRLVKAQIMPQQDDLFHFQEDTSYYNIPWIED